MPCNHRVVIQTKRKSFSRTVGLVKRRPLAVLSLYSPELGKPCFTVRVVTLTVGVAS